MRIWADADSLPPEVRATIARRAAAEAARGEAARLDAVFVANRRLPERARAGVAFEKVAAGTTADDYIAENASVGDLVVTRDIPLAARLCAMGISCINDRGEAWTADTARERASLRDAMAELRAQGLAEMETRRSYGPKELKRFADAFDRSLTKLLPPTKF